MRDYPVVVYEPDQRVRIGFFSCWPVMFRSLFRSRELIWQLFRRDFLSTYKQSLFGVFWLLISPVVGIISWVFMNYTGMLNPGDMEVPYPVYILFGTTLWGMFMSVFSASAASLTSGGSLILQVNFSHAALVAQQLAQTIVNLIINVATLSLVLIIFRVWPDWTGVLLFFLAIIPIFLLGSGIGMVISVFAVVVRDITRIVTSGLGLLFFVTPVIYAPQFQNPVIQRIIWWNPLTYLIGGARDIVLHGRLDHSVGYVISILLSGVVFLMGWRLFFLSEHKVAEKL